MVNNFRVIFEVTLKSLIRDRLLQVLLACALFIFLVVPALSLFSMRQVQELSVTLSLSAISIILLVLTVILGSSSIWRDIERRYLASVLGLPVSRTSYIMGKFFGIVTFIMVGSILLGLVATVVIALVSSQYPSDIPVRWLYIWAAILMDGFKYVLVAAVALLFSAVSTSFYLPFIATLVVYFCGSASQGVYEYITSDYGKTMSAMTRNLISSIYYLIPNFAAFDFKVQAVYPLAVPFQGLLFTGVYFLIYTGMVLMIAVWVFNRRELA
ncbi:MAG: ABC transporter permease subunit [Geobacteraceae bacterium]|nr:ABC transporter permease subunit [Geobacteraceae bacterium]